MAETPHTHHHRQIIWLDDQPKEWRLNDNPDLIERFITRLVDLVRELGKSRK